MNKKRALHQLIVTCICIVVATTTLNPKTGTRATTLASELKKDFARFEAAAKNKNKQGAMSALGQYQQHYSAYTNADGKDPDGKLKGMIEQMQQAINKL